MKYTKRILSLLLSLTLVLGLLPAGVLAEDDNSITVYVSVSEGGAFVTGKNNTGIAYVPVEVTSATPTINDAFKELHNSYFDGDANSAYGSSGDWITNFWNNGNNVSYYHNNQYPQSVNESVEDGDTLNVFFYADTTGWSDCYTCFSESEKTVAVNSDVTFTLNTASYSGSAPIDGTDKNTCLTLNTVDADGGLSSAIVEKIKIDQHGQFTYKFDETGTYKLTCSGSVSGNFAVPPLCKVTVLSTEQNVEIAYNSLTAASILGQNSSLDNLSSNIELPTSNYENTKITWTLDSSNIDVLSFYGNTLYVSDPTSTDTTATLTATITSTITGSTATKVKTFNLKVPAATSDKDSVAGVVKYADIIKGIATAWNDNNTATSAIADNDLPWAAIDMKAYGQALDGAESSRYTTELAKNKNLAKYILAEKALGNSIEEDITAPTDNSKTNVYSAPYDLLARYSTGNTNAADNKNLINTMITYLSGSNKDVDAVAATLPALALYYENDSAVKTAVDSAVTWLSEQQSNDGTWKGNSNSTAIVIVGLSALGIDAHTDNRFIKNYKSAIEGLLTFALSDNSGFGHGGNVKYNAMSTEQGFRALVAYARYKESSKESSKAYNIYLQAKDSQNTVPAPNISATVVPSPPSNPEKQIQVSATVDALGETWATGSYTVKANTTVGDVLKKLFADNGITCVWVNGAYISSVTKNGVTLKEKDKGTGSGWMYRVNGVMPSVGVNGYELSDGDTISFFYTTDYTKEDGAQQDTSTTTTPAFSDVSAGSYYAEAVEWAVKKGITVGTSDTTFSPDDNCTREQMAMFLWKAAGSPEPKQTGTGFTDLPGGNTAKAMLWVAEQNITSGTSDTTFSPETTCTRAQMAAFLYRYAGSPAVSGTCAFADVSAEAYYHDAVLWCVHQSITAGTGGEKFSPDAPCTRGQMVTFLYRFLGNHS